MTSASLSDDDGNDDNDYNDGHDHDHGHDRNHANDDDDEGDAYPNEDEDEDAREDRNYDDGPHHHKAKGLTPYEVWHGEPSAIRVVFNVRIALYSVQYAVYRCSRHKVEKKGSGIEA